MSEKDRFDWSDDTDFESLADEPIEGFADFDDMEDFDDAGGDATAADADLSFDGEESPDESATERAAESNEAAPREPVVIGSPHGRGISSGELGVLFSVSTLVAAAGVGSASLLAFGINPASLWQPDVFLNWNNYLALENNPLNVLVLVCVGIVLLTMLGSWAIGKAARGASDRTRKAEDMLEQVTKLRLEDESAWQESAFGAYPAAASFVSETLGAWRLQAARYKHFTGMEGELHRLEKALSDDSRTDLDCHFDSPAVGALSDQMTRYFDERAAAHRQIEDLRNKDQATSAELMEVLQDARCWHHASAQNLGLQGASLDRLAGRFNEFSTELAQNAVDPELKAAFKDIRADLDRLRSASANTPDVATELVGLVDQGSKLAFQIAMEVARLGPRGERLGPMSQSLEDLTTDFRKVSSRISADEGPAKQWADDLAGFGSSLADLESRALDPDDAQWQEQAKQFGPAAGQLAQNLADMVQSHAPQAARLTNLGTDFSQFSGADFDPDKLNSNNPDSVPSGVLTLEGRTPFSHDEDSRNEGSIHQPADVDPFAVTPPAQANEGPADSSFTSSVGEPAADIFGSGLDRSELPSLELDTSFGVKRDPFEAGPVETAEPQLPVAEEKVYDLDDFGALPADSSDESLTDEDDGVYELSDFAAEPIVDTAPIEAQDEVHDQVHDLAAFGAVRLDSPQGDAQVLEHVPEEEVFDLNTFGAVPLN